MTTTVVSVPNGYKLVRDEDDYEEVKSCMGAVPKALRAHPSMARGVRATKPVRAYLSYYAATSGAVNTAFGGGVGIIPNQDSSWASWQAVFDEFKVISAEAIFNAFYTIDPTANPTNSANMIVVYDPTTTVALASVNAGLQFEKYRLQRIMIPNASGPKVSPMVVTQDGFSHFSVKIPTGSQISNVTTTNSPGLWRPTGDATNYDWGNFTYYVSQGGATSQLRVEFFVRMLVEFRVRR